MSTALSEPPDGSPPRRSVDLLIIGAGPFGLAIAAQAASQGIDYLVVGRPMEFWRSHMPRGMILRSGSDWHLDPTGNATILSWLTDIGLTRADVEPLSLERYLAYASWFIAQKRVALTEAYVAALDQHDSKPAGFCARLSDGRTIVASRVVIAIGFAYFRTIPPELAAILPPGRFAHSCEEIEPARRQGQRCLVVGGRQSAFEQAALLAEAGAAAVHVVHRHDSPRFAHSDWSWVGSMVASIPADPGWYRALSASERDALGARFWAEGRLKVEPWLEQRCAAPSIRLWPNTSLRECAVGEDGAMTVSLDDGTKLPVDHVTLATGYKVDLARVPFLAAGNLLNRLAMSNGSPVLDTRLQTSIPGLYMTSMAATASFGAFFAFTVSARASAQLIGAALAA